MRTGLLLINLGTPDEPTTPAVRRYLREFLGDPRVIDINPIGRALLLNLVILPTRPAKSAAAYRTIWDAERGSPLLYHSRDLAAAVAERLGDSWQVELAMRYGKPSIADALDRLAAAGITRVVVLPLFPQHAMSSTDTAVVRVQELARKRWPKPDLAFVGAFYDHPAFIDAFAKVARPSLAELQPDYVLFSYHGLPERQIKKLDATGSHCLAQAGCCDRITDANRLCYRAHCYATTRALVAALELGPIKHSVSFQSRLGKTPWIQPFTDHVLDQLPKQGVRRLAVMCPAFVADCLETLEEIGDRARAQFLAAGGEELRLIQSLNSHPAWADAVVTMARAHATEVPA